MAWLAVVLWRSSSTYNGQGKGKPKLKTTRLMQNNTKILILTKYKPNLALISQLFISLTTFYGIFDFFPKQSKANLTKPFFLKMEWNLLNTIRLGNNIHLIQNMISRSRTLIKFMNKRRKSQRKRQARPVLYSPTGAFVSFVLRLCSNSDLTWLSYLKPIFGLILFRVVVQNIHAQSCIVCIRPTQQNKINSICQASQFK